MIVADTNVVSEPLRPQPEPRVLAWLAAHAERVALTTITVAELFYGVRRLPVGHRRTALSMAIETAVAAAGTRVLGFDEAAARSYADLRATREARGWSVPVEDTMIAAICLAGDHAIATRNTRHSEESGLTVLNPWAGS